MLALQLLQCLGLESSGCDMIAGKVYDDDGGKFQLVIQFGRRFMSGSKPTGSNSLCAHHHPMPAPTTTKMWP